MPGLLEGKVAFITGAARGQGRAHAVVSAREGADIIAVDLVDQIGTVEYPMSSQADLDETVRQVEALDRRIVATKADVRDQAQLDAAVKDGIAQLGKVDILIANAGIYSLAPFWELTDQQWQDMIDVNLTGVWHAAKAVAPHMIERGSGSMVLTSSINGIEPGINYAHYVAAKFGVRGLAKNIALELAPYGIRCNSVHPGAIDTGMTHNHVVMDMFAGHEGGTDAEFYDAGYGFHALKGVGFMPPEVIANAALFLNSDLAATITGVELPVDAGHLLIPGINLSPIKP